MAVTPLPFLDRTSASFKTDTDTFFGQQLPQFSVEVNQVASDVQAAVTAANSSKTAAATSATNAGTSATNAANSATAANTSKTNAATSETNAAGSATAANTSKTAAANSATAAATSATNSEASAVRAKQAADSISSGPVTSVNGKTGVVTLNKGDIALGAVDNLSVLAKGMLAASGQIPVATNLDDFTNLTNGWYTVSATGSTGTKPPGESWGTLLVAGRAFQADSRTNQLFFSEAGTRIYLRQSTGGNWTLWRELTSSLQKGIVRFTASGSWVVPEGVTLVWVSGVAPGGGGGGGGAGGASAYYGAGGAGGAAGQSVIRSAQSVVPGQTITITIGSPGAGGASSAGVGNNGTAGGALTVTNMSGANLILSGGGPGGGGQSSNNGAFISGGGLISPGFPMGMYGGDTDGTQPTCIGGVGGSSPFGGGGSGGRASTSGTLAGLPAGGYGAGGGGGGGQYSKPSPTYSGSAGGNGSGGLAIIEW
jgi:hypothetical protein